MLFDARLPTSEVAKVPLPRPQKRKKTKRRHNCLSLLVLLRFSGLAWILFFFSPQPTIHPRLVRTQHAAFLFIYLFLINKIEKKDGCNAGEEVNQGH
jgi:hypothetical protein